MRNFDHSMTTWAEVRTIAVAGAALAAVAFASSPVAAAQPPVPPPGPAIVPPPPTPAGPQVPIIGQPLAANGLAPVAQSGAPAAGPFGLPQMGIGEFLLPQNPSPSAPGGHPGAPPNLNAFNNAYLLPQHVEPSAPGEGEVFDVAPGAENADISGLDYVKRVWHMYEGGYLKGSLLGQLPHEQLGAPLPGTAPPPGTTIPPGLAPPAAPPPQPVP
jgi:hypothetical protein